MASDDFNGYFVKVWEVANEICAAHPEYSNKFVLTANGGKRQEVQQVHFHLFSDHEIVKEYSMGEHAESIFYSDGDIRVIKHP